MKRYLIPRLIALLLLGWVAFEAALADSSLRWKIGVGYRYPVELKAIKKDNWSARTGNSRVELVSSPPTANFTSSRAFLRKLAQGKAEVQDWSVKGSADATRLDLPDGSSVVCFRHGVTKGLIIVVATAEPTAKGEREVAELLASIRNDAVAYAKNQVKRTTITPSGWHRVAAPDGGWSLSLPGSESEFMKYPPPVSVALVAREKQRGFLFNVFQIDARTLEGAKTHLNKLAKLNQVSMTWGKTSKGLVFGDMDIGGTYLRSYLIPLKGGSVLEVRITTEDREQLDGETIKSVLASVKRKSI